MKKRLSRIKTTKKLLSDDSLLKIGPASTALGVSIDTLRRWEKNGKIKAVKTPGGTRLYSPAELNRIKPGTITPEQTESLSTEELLRRTSENGSSSSLSFRVISNDALGVTQPSSSLLTKFLIGGAITSVATLAVAGFMVASSFFQKSQHLEGVTAFFHLRGGQNVLAAATASRYLEINTDTKIFGTLNNLSLEATPSANSIALISGNTQLNIIKSAKLDQDVSTIAAPTFNTLNLSAAKDQLVFQSEGLTGTLSWTPTAARVLTLPDATTTLVGKDTTDTLTNKSISGSSNTLTSIPNSALSNSKVTVTAGTNLSGGGDITLGSSVTLALKDSPSISGTLTVAGASTLTSSSLSIAGVAYTYPSSQGASSTVLSNNGAGTLSWGTIGASGITADSLDFTEISDTLTLDATTSIANAGYNLTITGTGAVNFNNTGNVGIGSSLTVTGSTTIGVFDRLRVNTLADVAALNVSGNLGVGSSITGFGALNGLNVTGLSNLAGLNATSANVAGTGRFRDLITHDLILANGSFANILQGYAGYSGYTSVTGGLGTGGVGSITPAQRITSTGNLVNIGSIQAGETLLTSAGTFNTKVDYGTGSGPRGVAMGDVNGDGKADLAVANENSATVSVLTNKGDGTFNAKVDYTTGTTPVSVAIGDVNGDGKADLAVTNWSSSTVSVFTNKGDGTFNAKVDYTTGTNPYGVAIGDLNGDGKADLAVANFNSYTVSVFTNTGTGTFNAKVDYTTGSVPRSVAIGDVNGDGKADLAVANENSATVSVFTNKGDGTFNTRVDYTTGTTPRSVAIGDLNGDGKADLAVANNGSTSVSVLTNKTTTIFYANALTGNVGIGTSASMTTNNLSVFGGVGIGNSGPNGFSNSLAPSLGLAIQGNVGIGTTSPAGALHVVGQCVTGDTLLKRRRRKSRKDSEKLGGPDPKDTSGVGFDSPEVDGDEWEDVRIDQIKSGDEILTLDEKTGEFVYQKVNNLMDMGIQDVYQLITETGKRIRTTGTHPYLIKEADKKIITGTFEVDQSNRIEDLSKDSFIAIANKQHSFVAMISKKEKKRIHKFYQKTPKLFGPVLWARIIAYLVRENNIKEAKLILDQEYPTYEKAINQIIGKNTEDIIIEYKSIGHKSKAHFAAYNTAYLANKKATGALVVNQVAEDLLHPATSAAIRKPSSRLKKDYHKLADLSRAEWTKVYDIQIGSLVATVAGWEKIISLKKVSREQVYDIEVENTHNFVGNDIVAHNTYITGNVGLGIASPATNLHLLGSGTGTGVQLLTQNSTQTNFGLSVLDNGNVGIGTTGPGGLLDVATGGVTKFKVDTNGAYVTSANSSGIAFTVTDNNGGVISLGQYNGSLIKNSSGVLNIAPNSGVLSIGVGGVSYGNSISFYNNGIASIVTGASGTSTGLAINESQSKPLILGAITTSETTHVVELAENTKLRAAKTFQWTTGIIDGNGNVGIGTASPTDKLIVSGGNVGIGVSSPLTALAVNGAGTIGWGVTGVAGPANGLAVSGNVGVGTTSPLANLHVVGQCVAWDTRIRIRRRRRKNTSGKDDILDTEHLPGEKNALHLEGGWDYLEVMIKDIKSGDEVLSLNDQTGDWEWHQVEKTMDMGIQTTYLLITGSGKNIRTTSNHPYLIRNKLSFGSLTQESYIDKDNSYGIEGNHYRADGEELIRVNIHLFNFLSLKNIPATRAIIAAGKLSVNNPRYFVTEMPKNPGEISNTPNQPDAKLMETSANASLTADLENIFLDNILTYNLTKKQVSVNENNEWVKVSQIKPGMEIATIDGWERVVAVKEFAREQTYDLQIANTHNFVGNNIVAHNTYITGNVGLGIASPATNLHLLGSGTGTGVNLLTQNNTQTNFGLSVLDNGNVGIGTTNPTSSLTVAGGYTQTGTASNTFTGTTSFTSTGGVSVDYNLAVTRSITAAALDGSYLTVGSLPADPQSCCGVAGKTRIGTGNTSYVGLIIQGAVGQTADLQRWYSGTSGGTAGILARLTNTGALSLQTSAANNTLNVAGNVGIGVSFGTVAAPINGLAVEGNVGIGTTSPAGALHVVGQCVSWDTRIRIRRRRRRRTWNLELGTWMMKLRMTS
ncbi:VCBS repeat-containing protein [Candidatus Daviesbacteria bacterium]|nr:VCBS repeat-containing protein [Candidatus Daviesbacteria bacterium]